MARPAPLGGTISDPFWPSYSTKRLAPSDLRCARCLSTCAGPSPAPPPTIVARRGGRPGGPQQSSEGVRGRELRIDRNCAHRGRHPFWLPTRLRVPKRQPRNLRRRHAAPHPDAIQTPARRAQSAHARGRFVRCTPTAAEKNRRQSFCRVRRPERGGNRPPEGEFL